MFQRAVKVVQVRTGLWRAKEKQNMNSKPSKSLFEEQQTPPIEMTE